MNPQPDRTIDRRSFLGQAALGLAVGTLSGLSPACATNARRGIAARETIMADDLQEKTIFELQLAMETGRLTSTAIVGHYLARIEAIDRAGPELRSIIELNPAGLSIAAALDAERAANGPRGPLHGIPILLKDNIDTADTMLTTAGSLALVNTRPSRDATVASQLRQAGAVIIGKTNLSEWANFRSTRSTSGWSARGGQTRNPYVLNHNPCGSSSGSAVAVAANLVTVTLGTETDGSLVCPASINGVVGLKPTVGLTSRAGVIPISHSQDTVGPIARTVTDAALVLSALTGIDGRDPATRAAAHKSGDDFTQYLDPDGLRNARIGVPRQVYFGYNSEVDQIIEAAMATMSAAGAVMVDPADIPTAREMEDGVGEFEVLLYEFKANLNRYLAGRVPAVDRTDRALPQSLADIIAFNEARPELELPHFGQEIFYAAEAKGPLTEPAYQQALAANLQRSRRDGLDAVMDRYQLDALVAPTGPPAWPTNPDQGDVVQGGSSSPAAMAGYPLVSVPAGFISGLPVGITFMGRAFSEPALIKLAYAFEQLTGIRRQPQFQPTL
jgi:amidase